jgi:hypothetical protein
LVTFLERLNNVLVSKLYQKLFKIKPYKSCVGKKNATCSY